MRDAYRLRQAQRPSLALQRLRLSAETDGVCTSPHIGKISWKYSTKPSPLSRTYEVLITNEAGGKPEAFILSPDLNVLAAGGVIPHIYRDKQCYAPDATCLCLYRIKRGDWNSRMLLANTVVPWVDLWLLFFEDWVVSKEWSGGGDHPVQTSE